MARHQDAQQSDAFMSQAREQAVQLAAELACAKKQAAASQAELQRAYGELEAMHVKAARAGTCRQSQCKEDGLRMEQHLVESHQGCRMQARLTCTTNTCHIRRTLQGTHRKMAHVVARCK
jgi:hypothetical protein